MIIRFEHNSTDVLTEYAALKEEEPGMDTILSGALYTSDKQEIDNSRVSATLLGDNQDAQVSKSHLVSVFNVVSMDNYLFR